MFSKIQSILVRVIHSWDREDLDKNSIKRRIERMMVDDGKAEAKKREREKNLISPSLFFLFSPGK